MNGIITAQPDLCKRCYGCIRECPAKAILVVNGQASIVQERCIACGHCIKVCTQGAKKITPGISDDFEKALNSGLAIAIVAPSFAASWHSNYGKVPSALRKLGFIKVIEAAFGADLISPLYAKELETSEVKPIISSSCPAVCNYIQKYRPELVPNLAKIVSPMGAAARYIRSLYGDTIHIAFIGPCTAKKSEILNGGLNGIINSVFTFKEIKNIISDAGINIDEVEEGPFDEPHAYMGKTYPLAGGLLKTAELSGDILEKEIIVVEGKSKTLMMLDEIAHNQINAKFVDVLFCEGCISGPGIDSSLNYYSRREKIIEYVKDSLNEVDKKVWQTDMYNSRDLDLTTEFRNTDQRRQIPDEETLERILKSINKSSEGDRLNCGACGYFTCREFAITVGKELAEKEMCLPYLIDELQNAYESLRTTQEQLHSAEKLASIGQLAAGIAHEINNPLGTIMLYASLISRQIDKLENSAGCKDDVSVIMNEAHRCKNIVANLLNFARQGKLALNSFDIFNMVADILKKLKPQPFFQNIKVELNLDSDDPIIEADKEQIEQVLLNLMMNAAEAMENSIEKNLEINISDISSEKIKIVVSDTGCGIEKENYKNIFTPFFTTKKIGKGTGLGMAIAYGIIKMHHGEITFESTIGKGSAFTVTLYKHISLSNSLIN